MKQQINMNQLLQIIGQKEVENTMLRQQIAELEQQREQGKEISNKEVSENAGTNTK